MLSSIWLEKYVSPVLLKSAHGVPAAIAPGIGKCSCLARNTMANARPPPAELPTIPMFSGFAMVIATFHTAIASSSPAGNGKSGGMR